MAPREPRTEKMVVVDERQISFDVILRARRLYKGFLFLDH
jgi:hypothetical protein